MFGKRPVQNIDYFDFPYINYITMKRQEFQNQPYYNNPQLYYIQGCLTAPTYGYQNAFQGHLGLCYSAMTFDNFPPSFYDQSRGLSIRQQQTNRENLYDQHRVVKVEATGQESQSLENQLINITSYKLYRRKRRTSKESPAKYSSKAWSLGENRRYLQFLQAKKELFALSAIDRKNIKINVLMSQKIKTRSSEQCRSHHQKMMKKHGNLDLVISLLEKEVAHSAKNKNVEEIQELQVKQEQSDEIEQYGCE